MPRALHLSIAQLLLAACVMACKFPAPLQKWFDIRQTPLYLRGTLEVIDEIQHHQGTYDGETYWLPLDRIIRLRLQGTQTMLVVWERRRSGDAGPTIKTWVSDPPSA